MIGDVIPDSNHLIRNCPSSTLTFDQPSAASFMPGYDMETGKYEDHLSAFWQERQGRPTIEEVIQELGDRYRRSNKDYVIGGEAKLAVVEVGRAKSVVFEATGISLSAHFLPTTALPTHAGLLGYDVTDGEGLVEAMAEELSDLVVFCETFHSVPSRS